MNRKTAIIATTVTIIGLSACTPAQVRQYLDAAKPVVNHHSTVATPLPRYEATVTSYVVDIGTPLTPVFRADAPCGETGGSDCPQPASPPTTVYTGPARQQCEDGSFAPQGECPAPANQPTTTEPEWMQCWDGSYAKTGDCQGP